MKRLVGLLLVWIVTLPRIALGGGTSYEVTIISFSRPEWGVGDFRVEARGPNKELMPGCSRIRVIARYELKPRRGHPDLSGNRHLQALEFVEAAFQAGRVIRFGLMGEGLLRSPGDPRCHFKSRALSVVKESEDVEAVYSYHKGT